MHTAASDAIARARKTKKPTVLVVDKRVRRFGHAATDRQSAYLTDSEIELAESSYGNMLNVAEACVTHAGMTTAEVEARFVELQRVAEEAFATAAQEPGGDSKGRKGLAATNSAAFRGVDYGEGQGLVLKLPLHPADLGASHAARIADDKDKECFGRRDVMRKHMTKGIADELEARPELIYIGEDVEHGGYYVVTEGLRERFGPSRVRDFPPDETTLVGAGIGFSQCGLLPVVEIPYAKYLDCGFDMFNEAVMANWLTDGKQPNGMVIRLQGFDRGVFGGNFHTSNMLPIPPGLDVLCFSNGYDWVRGFRMALDMAKAGRVVMLVDSTALLARRHLVDGDKDGAMLTPFPIAGKTEAGFHDVSLYCEDNGAFADARATTEEASSTKKSGKAAASKKATKRSKARVLIVAYGNGVPLALESVATMRADPDARVSKAEYAVVDVPCLSEVPDGLRQLLDTHAATHVVFADVCKEGPGMPLGAHAVTLHEEGALDHTLRWSTVGAARTYNPLGSLETFLSIDDIHAAVRRAVL